MDELPPVAVFLKRLVLAMAVVMIAGFVVLIVTLVTRLNGPSLSMPDSITLPDGVEATSYTVGNGWYAVVAGDEILVFNATTGAMTQRVQIDYQQ